MAVVVVDGVPDGGHDIDTGYFVVTGQIDGRFIGVLPDEMDLSRQGRRGGVARDGRFGAARRLDREHQEQDRGEGKKLFHGDLPGTVSSGVRPCSHYNG